MSTTDDEPEMSQPCDEWQALIGGAHAAGRLAARRLARRSSAWYLGRSGSIAVHVEPLASPVATWLHSTGRAAITDSRTGVLVPITVTAADLKPAEEAPQKARSLLVADAYAAAFSDVLADEAGVATEIRIVSESLPAAVQRSRGPEPAPEPRVPPIGERTNDVDEIGGRQDVRRTSTVDASAIRSTRDG